MARHVVTPAGIVATGWPAVRDTCRSFGITFDCWQDGAGRLILAKRRDGLYAADAVVISIPRQVGKTYLIGWIIFALCLIFPGLTVLWTAHRYKTASETYRAMASMAGKKKVRPHIESVPRGAGEQAIVFTNGSRILFGARERGFGRGFSDVDVEVFDEAQILTQNAIDDMVPATNAARNPLLVYTGTPPKPSDPSEVFTEFRDRAISGQSSDVLYLEMSADPDADPRDRAQWRKANPSYPHRTPDRSILRMLNNLTLESFMREGYGIWDSDAKRLVGLWADALLPAAKVMLPTSFAVAVDPDREWSAIGAAGAACVAADKSEYLAVDLVQHEQGTGGVVARLTRLREAWGCSRVVVDGGGPAASLIPELQAAQFEVVVAGTRDVAAAYGLLVDGLTEHTVKQSGAAPLDDAVKSARTRPCGDGGQAFGRKASGTDITPLEAVSLAHWLAATSPTVNVLNTIW